ncbi:MAG TPA: DUF4399 domain-containing protein [Solimonas sp.]
MTRPFFATPTLTLAALGLILTALPASADNWSQLKDAAKKQAGEKAETQFNLPQAAPQGAKVYFIEPKDGAAVTSPVRIVFGLANMGVAPAGVNQVNTGHHHLLIDEPTIDLSKPLPATDQVKHFGGGQTETTVELKPGTHTLQLLLGDWKHQPHNPAIVSEKIKITVKAAGQ